MVLNKVGEHEVTSDFSGDVDVNIGGDVSSSDTVTLSASNTQNISSDTTVSLSDSGSLNKTVNASISRPSSIVYEALDVSGSHKIVNDDSVLDKVVAYHTPNSSIILKIQFREDGGGRLIEISFYNDNVSAPATIDLQADLRMSAIAELRAQGDSFGVDLAFATANSGDIDIYGETLSPTASIS